MCIWRGRPCTAYWFLYLNSTADRRTYDCSAASCIEAASKCSVSVFTSTDRILVIVHSFKQLEVLITVALKEDVYCGVKVFPPIGPEAYKAISEEQPKKAENISSKGIRSCDFYLQDRLRQVVIALEPSSSHPVTRTLKQLFLLYPLCVGEAELAYDS